MKTLPRAADYNILRDAVGRSCRLETMVTRICAILILLLLQFFPKLKPFLPIPALVQGNADQHPHSKARAQCNQ